MKVIPGAMPRSWPASGKSPKSHRIAAVGIRSMSEEEAQVADQKETFYGHALD